MLYGLLLVVVLERLESRENSVALEIQEQAAAAWDERIPAVPLSRLLLIIEIATFKVDNAVRGEISRALRAYSLKSRSIRQESR
jgi:hypothetical protein